MNTNDTKIPNNKTLIRQKNKPNTNNTSILDIKTLKILIKIINNTKIIKNNIQKYK